MKLVWHPLAMADRECIMNFIARDTPLATLALDENSATHANRIETNPHLYRPGRVSGTREAVVHPNYLMVYRIESETITIPRTACRATLAVGQIAIGIPPASSFVRTAFEFGIVVRPLFGEETGVISNCKRRRER